MFQKYELDPSLVKAAWSKLALINRMEAGTKARTQVAPQSPITYPGHFTAKAVTRGRLIRFEQQFRDDFEDTSGRQYFLAAHTRHSMTPVFHPAGSCKVDGQVIVIDQPDQSSDDILHLWRPTGNIKIMQHELPAVGGEVDFLECAKREDRIVD